LDRKDGIMKLPKLIIKKMNKIRDLRREASNLEHEVYQWFESKGIETDVNEFIDIVGDKISYGEFDSDEEIQMYFEEFQKEYKS
jgi:hypothetical protein